MICLLLLFRDPGQNQIQQYFARDVRVFLKCMCIASCYAVFIVFLLGGCRVFYFNTETIIRNNSQALLFL